ncbi:MAG: S41 family peptidase [Planctomycetota bacterium]
MPQWEPGFACLEDDQGRPVVYYVRKGSPAEQAGVKAGMIVLALNGEDADKVIEKTMKRRSKYIGYSSERYLRYHAYRFFVRQSDQRTVKLRILDTAGRVLDIDLPCTVKAGYLPRLPVPNEGIADSGSVSWKMLNGRVGYIYVRRIRQDLIASLDKAVAELNNARGLIIDVRGNSGGGYDARRAHLNFALDRDSEEPDRPRFKGPMALLIDSRCVSAGEGWASWFIANKRARVFGEATAGASSRKKTYTLKNGLYRVKYPVKAYKGSLDRPIERRGLEPDVPVKPAAADIAAGKDTVLQRAKEYLLERP